MPNFDELLSRLPSTDADIKAGMPVPPGPGSKFTGPAWTDAAKLCEEVLAGGPAALAELIGLLRDPATEEFKSFKPEYLLHILTTYAGASERSGPRRLIVTAMAAQVTSTPLSAYVRSVLIRELQWLGDSTALPALAKCLTLPELCQPAVTAMLAIGDGAAAPLRQALPAAQGPCRLTILHGLAYLADPDSAAAFRAALTDPSEPMRLTSAWGLSQLADPADVPAMLKAADIPSSYERTKLTSACIQLAENLTAKGKKEDATTIYTFLRIKRTGPKEKYLQDLATKALAGL